MGFFSIKLKSKWNANVYKIIPIFCAIYPFFFVVAKYLGACARLWRRRSSFPIGSFHFVKWYDLNKELSDAFDIISLYYFAINFFFKSFVFSWYLKYIICKSAVRRRCRWRTQRWWNESTFFSQPLIKDFYWSRKLVFYYHSFNNKKRKDWK